MQQPPGAYNAAPNPITYGNMQYPNFGAQPNYSYPSTQTVPQPAMGMPAQIGFPNPMTSQPPAMKFTGFQLSQPGKATGTALGSSAAQTATPSLTINTSGIQDGNNDASAWQEYENEVDKRKYWYNTITNISTYEKPACLKTPEERSIPACPWKEYATPEGRKYYGNGSLTT
jgi:hypothetical protein